MPRQPDTDLPYRVSHLTCLHDTYDAEGQTATQSDEDGKHHIVVWLWRHVAVAEAILETAVIVLEAAVVLITAIVLIAVVVTITVIILLIRLLWLIVLIHN